MKIKLVSWNVNGIRACVKNGFGDFLKKENPDILGLQEIKISHVVREKEEFDFTNREECWNPAERPGYSGTAILWKQNLKKLVKNYVAGMGDNKFDIEGRVQTLELDKFYFVNVYFPNSSDLLKRLSYKLEFNEALLKYLKRLEKKKPVVVCGDFNVAHEEIDIARPKENRQSAGFTEEERTWADKFIGAGFIDTYRFLNPQKIEYSWWSYRFYARDRNIGWRIDYFFVSEALKKNIKEAFILTEVLGSDHAPVGLVLDL